MSLNFDALNRSGGFIRSDMLQYFERLTVLYYPLRCVERLATPTNCLLLTHSSDDDVSAGDDVDRLDVTAFEQGAASDASEGEEEPDTGY